MTTMRPEYAPLPPGAVLPPMAAPEALQGLPQTRRAADAGAGTGRGRQRPNKPNQTRQSSNSRGRELGHNPSRFETINTFVDVTLRGLSGRAALAWLVLWPDWPARASRTSLVAWAAPPPQPSGRWRNCGRAS